MKRKIIEKKKKKYFMEKTIKKLFLWCKKKRSEVLYEEVDAEIESWNRAEKIPLPRRKEKISSHPFQKERMKKEKKYVKRNRSWDSNRIIVLSNRTLLTVVIRETLGF